MKLLIAEDTKDLNRVIKMALEHEGHDVDSALDGVEASEFLKHNAYDFIILDIMMPRKDGISVLKELREQHITSPVLMLTAKAEVDDRVEGLDAGADDYMPKPFAMKELLAKVRAMVRRQLVYDGQAEYFADIHLDSSTCELRCENSVRLSLKEFELLQYLIKNSDHRQTYEDLLRNVWSDSVDARKETVELYILYLRSKLKAVSSKVSILEDEEEGYILENAHE